MNYGSAPEELSKKFNDTMKLLDSADWSKKTGLERLNALSLLMLRDDSHAVVFPLADPDLDDFEFERDLRVASEKIKEKHRVSSESTKQALAFILLVFDSEYSKELDIAFCFKTAMQTWDRPRLDVFAYWSLNQFFGC